MRPVQIYINLLISTWIVSCLATEKKPFYEHLYNPEDLFQVEDHHADLVLGMLPTIKTSIKDFRKRNYSRHDIENMYQTLTIFWPVVRSYLKLTEELLGDVSSNRNDSYLQLSSNSVSEDEPSFDKLDFKIPTKEETGLSNIQSINTNSQSKLSRTSSLSSKTDQQTSAQIISDIISTSQIHATVENPIASISTTSEKKQHLANTRQSSIRNRFGVKQESVRPSLPMNDNKRTIQSRYPNRNVQSKYVIGQVVTTTETPPKTISNKPLPTAARSPVKITKFDQLSTFNDGQFKSRSHKPLSIISRRLSRPTSKPPVTRNTPNLAIKAGRLVSTTIDRPTPLPISRTRFRSNLSSPSNSNARRAPKLIGESLENQQKQMNLSSQSISTLDKEDDNKSSAERIFFFRGTQDLSRLLKVIGKPIDLSEING